MKNEKDQTKIKIKECKKLYRETHKVEIAKYNKLYRESHKKESKAYRKKHSKEYRDNNKEKIKKYQKIYCESHKKEKMACDKKYHEDNKEKRNAYSKIYRKNNKEKIKLYGIKWYRINKDKVKARSMIYKEKRNKRLSARRKTDPKFRLNENISGAIWFALKGNKNGRHWECLVGYTLNKLMKHLEKLFTDGMTWENYGKWHVDHKTPISVFNFTKPEHRDFRRCWALKNLQPLWAQDNISKFNKLNKHFQPSLLF